MKVILKSVSAQTAKIVPITPLAGQCEEWHRKKNYLHTFFSPLYSSSYCISKYVKARKNKTLGKKNGKKKSSVRGLKSIALFAMCFRGQLFK